MSSRQGLKCPNPDCGSTKTRCTYTIGVPTREGGSYKVEFWRCWDCRNAWKVKVGEGTPMLGEDAMKRAAQKVAQKAEEPMRK